MSDVTRRICVNLFREPGSADVLTGQRDGHHSRYEYQHEWQSEVRRNLVADIESQIRASEENLGKDECHLSRCELTSAE